MSLRQVTFNTAAMSSVTILRILVQTLVLPVLARFLSPEDYGVVAMAMPFVLFAMTFADAGIGISLVRTPITENKSWSTGFWLTIALGLGLAVAINLVGIAATWYLEEPRLGPIITALSFIIVLQSVATVPGLALQQKHRFGKIAAIEIVAMLMSLIAAFATAMSGGGAWALVAQQLAHYLTKLVLTSVLSNFRPHFLFDLKEIDEHLIIGRGFLGANFVTFLTQSMDSFVLGKALGSAQVGYYAMAFLFARLPGRILSGSLQLVIYPYLAKLKHNPEAINTIFLTLTRALSICIIPPLGLIAAAQEAIFPLILSDKWAQSGTIFMIVAPAVALQTVTVLRGSVVLAMGRTDISLRITIEYGLLWVALLLASVNFGIFWVAISYNIAVFAYLPRSIKLSMLLINVSTLTYLQTMVISVYVTLTFMFFYEAVIHMVDIALIAKLCLAIALCLCAMAASTALQIKPLVTGFRLVQKELKASM